MFLVTHISSLALFFYASHGAYWEEAAHHQKKTKLRGQFDICIAFCIESLYCIFGLVKKAYISYIISGSNRQLGEAFLFCSRGSITGGSIIGKIEASCLESTPCNNEVHKIVMT
jgi:hypothetical protein